MQKSHPFLWRVICATKSHLAHEPRNKHVFIQFVNKYVSYCFELMFGKFKWQSKIWEQIVPLKNHSTHFFGMPSNVTIMFRCGWQSADKILQKKSIEQLTTLKMCKCKLNSGWLLPFTSTNGLFYSNRDCFVSRHCFLDLIIIYH